MGQEDATEGVHCQAGTGELAAGSDSRIHEIGTVPDDDCCSDAESGLIRHRGPPAGATGGAEGHDVRGVGHVALTFLPTASGAGNRVSPRARVCKTKKDEDMHRLFLFFVPPFVSWST